VELKAVVGRWSSPAFWHLPSWNKSARLAECADRVHTPGMTMKSAALLALIGTCLAAVLLIGKFVVDILNVLRGLLPAAILFSSFIYALACFSVAVFFYMFHRGQS
jgi:hypothetical protein